MRTSERTRRSLMTGAYVFETLPTFFLLHTLSRCRLLATGRIFWCRYLYSTPYKPLISSLLGQWSPLFFWDERQKSPRKMQRDRERRDCAAPLLRAMMILI